MHRRCAHEQKLKKCVYLLRKASLRTGIRGKREVEVTLLIPVGWTSAEGIEKSQYRENVFSMESMGDCTERSLA